MVNYQLGKIYELVCLTTGKRYIGSTTKEYLSQRLVEHVRISKTSKPCTSKVIIDVNNYKIILLETYPCNSKDELVSKEYEYINRLDCVNKCRYLDRKEYSKQYHEANKELILEQFKQYYEANKQAISERKKQYNDQNKDKIKQQYELKKDKLNQRRRELRQLKTNQVINV